MLLFIDYGSAVAKLLVVQKDDSLGFLKMPARFSAVGNCSPQVQLEFLLKHVTEKFSAQPDKVYLSSGGGLNRFAGLVSSEAITTKQSLDSLGIGIIDIGSLYSYVLGNVVCEDTVDEEEIAKWIPFRVSLHEVLDYLDNKKLYRSIIPTTPRDLVFEEAIARVKILPTKFDVKDLDRVYLTGGIFSDAPHPKYALIPFLDALNLSGSIQVYVDSPQILPSLGMIRHFESGVYARVGPTKLASLPLLGTVLCLGGDISLDLDTGLDTSQVLELMSGELVQIPLEVNQTAQVKVVSSEGEQEFLVQGGELGLIVDTRPRPIKLPATYSERRKALVRWFHAISGGFEVL